MELRKIKYRTIWGKLYLMIALIFSVFFIGVSVILKDPYILLNLLAPLGLALIGWAKLTHPYIRYNNRKIIVHGYSGKQLREYNFKQPSEIKVKHDRLFLNGKKLRLNKWMTDKQDWQRFIRFFDEDDRLLNELQEV